MLYLFKINKKETNSSEDKHLANGLSFECSITNYQLRNLNENEKKRRKKFPKFQDNVKCLFCIQDKCSVRLFIHIRFGLMKSPNRIEIGQQRFN
ncbi:hypothetical protein BpHYR1_026319 [Brachionus plicatilis]|uniref:Uncharacterized protein n=1 Tax=Brachionus plicatilis TaxID=10195 RepID=A0A3M7QR99_BRAPC|nr:hypothetical protein BpHYR1_026319 [Brachionus plicatilis]